MDSYVRLNRGLNHEKARLIEQRLVGFRIRTSPGAGHGEAPTTTHSGAQETTATVVAREQCRYHYISLSTGRYPSPEHVE